MDYNLFHHWPASIGDAIVIQQDMRQRLDLGGNERTPSTIAAVETAYGFEGKTIYAAAVVMTLPELEFVEQTSDSGPVDFPYSPGLLYFREGRSVVSALAKIRSEPDVIVVHGHGTAHESKCGIASSVGVVFDRPTIGCARKLLAGRHREVEETRGSSEPILLGSEVVGIAYRSKDAVKPIFVSPGHRCNLDSAREVIVQCLRGYRLPEPCRLAHAAANRLRRKFDPGRQKVGPHS